MFSIGDKVYYVNCLGYTREKLYTISKITTSTIILQETFVGKRKKSRIFETHVNINETDQSLFKNLEEARKYSNERKTFVDSGVFPYLIGDIISWNNGKYSGEIIDINNRSYIVKTPNRVWSISPYALDVFKIN